ncbi:MAG: acetylxylan esterase [Planctomycetota bacterium]|nr:acetylxylan esterase [Planctomycetota bacterium]
MKIYLPGRVLALFCLVFTAGFAPAEEDAPESVQALWAELDPAAEPLDVRVVRQWEEDGLVLRYVTFHIGTFKTRAARIAAFYGFPRDAERLPALLHLHGGGQRAFLHEVRYYARRGYACLSINWGGRELEGAMQGEPNTDWGAVDPTQKNVPGYSNLLPGEKYLDAFQSPRNNNWYLLTIAGRRGLTFLERQREVDRERLGVYGHSMGGNLTVYVAGTDDRVKVAAPSVGGQGFRTMSWKLLPEKRRQVPNGDVELFRATLGFQSYAPRIKAPLLWLGSTNDFHGIMDDTYRTGALIPHKAVRYSFAPHLNHRFTPEFSVTRPLWLDQHLRRGFRFPRVPATRLVLDTVPKFIVTPESSRPVAKVDIMYSVDPDPPARFWRTAMASREGESWVAELPIVSIKQPLFAFANVHYKLEQPVEVPFARPTSTFAISSMLKVASPGELKKRGVQATDEPSRLIDDFSRGFQDWYRLSVDNPHHWQFWTRKITDPKWRGGDGESLVFEVRTERPNQLIVVITENFFRGYRGRRRGDSVTVVKLPGGGDWHTVRLAPGDFIHQETGKRLESWKVADLLGFRAYYGDRGDRVLGSTRWTGGRPVFRSLRWVKSDEDG